MIWVQPQPWSIGRVLEFLVKTLYKEYLCLVASNKQNIQWTRNSQKFEEIRKNVVSLKTFEQVVDFYKREIVITMKHVRNIP